MSDAPTPLTVTPTSARALAAARPGEEVTVRVQVEQPKTNLPGRDWQYELSEGSLLYVARRGRSKSVHLVKPPAAVGERVAVECPDCGGHGFLETDPPLYPCHTCKMRGAFPATVTAAPEPEAWSCEDCDGIGRLPDEGATGCGCGGKLTCIACHGVGLLPVHRCPTCNGTPSEHVWRVGVRLQGQGDDDGT